MSGPYGVWPADPNGDMTPILEASIDEAYQAARERHPSGKEKSPVGVLLSNGDRCDRCGAVAAYRVARRVEGPLIGTVDQILDYCLHHWRKHFGPMVDQGWAVIGGNPDLLEALGQGGADA